MPTMGRAELYSVFIGTGSVIPECRVPNEDFHDREFFADYGERFNGADSPKIVAKFREITDINERRYVSDDEVASDIAFEAARRSIAASEIDPELLDYIVVAHNFGDVRSDNRRSDFVPSLAARVKQQLEIANPSCVAYDLPFGCPGWVQAVIQTDYFLRSGDARYAVVIGAETLSRVSDPHDRDSMIYSDGAGAAVLEGRKADDPIGVLAHATRSDTIDHARLLWMGTSFNPEFQDDRLFLKMYGRKLYEYALTRVPGVVRDSLERAGLELKDVSKVLLHQANAKMDEAILKRLFRLYGEREVPSEIMPMTISWLGNSSVATIPTLLDLIERGELDGHRLVAGDVVVLASVGAGMNINSIVYRCP
jgi:3-oxoacyl-[acyl-carrier-protein] synthase-3